MDASSDPSSDARLYFCREMGRTSRPVALGLLSVPRAEDPLDFEYDNVRWDSNEKNTHHCSAGAYDKGKREMDCGFTCK